MNELFAFEEEVLHSIENNPKNYNFKFKIMARNDDERLDILNGVKENKEFFESELSKVIGNCIVLIDFDNLIITVKKEINIRSQCNDNVYLKR